MKALCATAAAVGLTLLGSMGSVSAQSDGGRGDGYRDRGSRNYENRDGEDRGLGDGFNEGEYLRCNPDVSQAVERGTMPSGAIHYRNFGQKEGRRLSC